MTQNNPGADPGATGEIQKPLFDQVQEAINTLVPQLQDGVARVALFGNTLAPELRLRESLCGPVSQAIKVGLAERDIEAELRENPLDELKRLYPGVPKSHVIDVVEDGDDSVIIDGTYGHLFRTFGLNWQLAEHLPTDPYPEEQVLVFRRSETSEVAEMLADTVEAFWEAHLYGHEYYQEWTNFYDKAHRVPKEPQPATLLPHEEIVAFFQEMYNLDQYHPYLPSADLQQRLEMNGATILHPPRTDNVEQAQR